MLLFKSLLLKGLIMSFQNLVENAKRYYPNLEIKYKDQSKFMRFLGLLLFFNSKFMANYTTTIGSTVYFPNEQSVTSRPISSSVVLLHELVHVYDSQKIGGVPFKLLYLFPQILVLFCLPVLFISWKLALVLMFLFMLPLPAYFRMNYEKRAYLVSLYSLHKLSKQLVFTVDLQETKKYYLKQFKSGYYYFMWPFSNIDKEFDLAVEKILKNEKPYEDEIFKIIDVLIASMQK